MLSKCLECGGLISDKATSCPHCGAPVDKKSECTPLRQGGAIVPKYHLLNIGKDDEWSRLARLDVEVANRMLSSSSSSSPQEVVELLLQRDHVAFGSLTFTVGCLKELSGNSRIALSHILSSTQELETALRVDKDGVDSFCSYYNVDRDSALRILSIVHDYVYRRNHNKFLAEDLDCISICPSFLPPRDGQYHFFRYIAVQTTRYISQGCFGWAFFSVWGLVVCLFDSPSREYIWWFLSSFPCVALTLWIYSVVSKPQTRNKVSNTAQNPKV